MKKRLVKLLAVALLAAPLAGCMGGLKRLKVVDFTDSRVGDLSLTRKVTGKREFLFFSTTTPRWALSSTATSRA